MDTDLLDPVSDLVVDLLGPFGKSEQSGGKLHDLGGHNHALGNSCNFGIGDQSNDFSCHMEN